TGYITLVLTKNTSVNFILHEFNESVFLLFSFFSGSAIFSRGFFVINNSREVEKLHKKHGLIICNIYHFNLKNF
ncbi:hypothetical protein VL806_14780, partial [Listeria seeligeri]